jgi:hypothetical protein
MFGLRIQIWFRDGGKPVIHNVSEIHYEIYTIMFTSGYHRDRAHTTHFNTVQIQRETEFAESFREIA